MYFLPENAFLFFLFFSQMILFPLIIPSMALQWVKILVFCYVYCSSAYIVAHNISGFSFCNPTDAFSNLHQHML